MFKYGFRTASRVARGGGFVRATGLLIGIWGSSYYFSNKRIHLDSTATVGRPEERITNQRKTIRSEVHVQSQVSDGGFHSFSSSAEPDLASGIARYDIAQVASNNPVEDEHFDIVFPVPNDAYWGLFTIFDGHNGWETAAWLRENLPLALAGALGDLYDQVKGSAAPPGNHPSPSQVEKTLKETFQKVDDEIVHESVETVFANGSKKTAFELLSTAYSGSCALVAFYDSTTRLLHVALTGDSRAILGRRVKDDSSIGYHYDVHVLSVDQNGANPAEQARLSEQHPGEVVVKGSRVMGWGTSRAFGDARWKWSVDVQKRLKEEFLGRSVPSNLVTPPYLIAEPEVTVTKIEPGDFLIMASDGLWECLSNEEAVGLVGWWLESGAGLRSQPGKAIEPTQLPVLAVPSDKASRYRQWNAGKRFINIDGNAASHLLRNALGGADEDLAAGLLSIRPPHSRAYRDDITAMVVFFGTDDN